MGKRQSTTRFKLLPYRPIAKRWRWPALLMIPAGVGFYYVTATEGRHTPQVALLALAPTVVGAVIFIYTILAARAHVSCHSNRIVVHTPFYPIAFSYQRLATIRSVEFRTLYPPENQKDARWRFYKDLWGRTVPTISLRGYPMALWWMKLWLHPFLFHPKETGLVLPVEEWMTMVRRIETLQTQWREGRR